MSQRKVILKTNVDLTFDQLQADNKTQYLSMLCVREKNYVIIMSKIIVQSIRTTSMCMSSRLACVYFDGNDTSHRKQLGN